VSGRLTSRPTAAAPKALITSSVRRTASMPRNGLSSTPARAANEQPSIHENVVTRAELVPMSSLRSASSTTARVWMPSRVARKNPARTSAEASEMATMIAWSYPTLTPGNRNVEREKIGSTDRVAGP
jgi:hypothetical protein